MKTLFVRFLAEHSGVTAIEYSMIATLVALLVIGGATLIGTSLSSTFSLVAGSL